MTFPDAAKWPGTSPRERSRRIDEAAEAVRRDAHGMSGSQARQRLTAELRSRGIMAPPVVDRLADGIMLGTHAAGRIRRSARVPQQAWTWPDLPPGSLPRPRVTGHGQAGTSVASEPCSNA